jgi:hypothetical protein
MVAILAVEFQSFSMDPTMIFLGHEEDSTHQQKSYSQLPTPRLQNGKAWFVVLGKS